MVTNAGGRLSRHVLEDGEFADTTLAKLKSETIDAWRERLTATPADGDLADAGSDKIHAMSPATMNRLLNDLRAALNRAALKYRRELPASLPQDIKIGTKAVEASTQARRQLLTDEQVRALVDASFEVDDSGDFGRLVTLLAATGARYSQVAALSARDLQPENRRVMMPGSRKGRSRRPKPPVAIPLGADVLERLRPSFEGRNDPDGALLMRWHHRKTGRTSWERDSRRRWEHAYDAQPYWPKVVAAAEVPTDTVMYSLRHSSIVRGLRAMLPIRLVAALHDTSSEMIEEHYAAFIVDATEDLARRASFDLQ